MNTITQEISREQFLTALFGAYLQESEGYIETREICAGQSGANPTFHRTLDSIINYSPTGDYYFGVCPRPGKSGKEADIEIIVSLWVDMDMEMEVAIKKLDSFSLKPSIVVNSGHGAHAYWLLREPEQIKANTKGILQGLAKALGADHCFDLPRILRVPGTKNLKTPNEPKDVQVIVFNPEIRYNLSDFEAYEVKTQGKCEVQVNFSNTQEDVNVEELKVSKAIKKLIKEGKQAGDRYPSRSEADFAVVCALVKAGYSDDTIKAIFDRYPIGEKYQEQGIDYLRHITGRAKEAVTVSKDVVFKANLYDLSKDGAYRLNLTKARCCLLGEHRIIYSGFNFYEYREGYYRETDIEVIKKWIMELTGSGLSKDRAEEIIYFLKADAFVNSNELNNTELLNVRNGLLDLNSFELLGHSPDIYSTIQLDTSYRPDAKCDLWIKTINELFPDEQREEKINILQEFFGLCLTKETRYEKALLCLGEGSNGKSVALWVLQHLLKKENVSAIPLEKFDNHHYLINLFGKLANISIETNAKAEVYDSMFKAIVTGDLIQADQKFKPAIHFNPFCKLVFATNNLPHVGDKSDAFFRRLLILRFNRQFSEMEQNKNLKYELLSELDGILLWSLEGLKRLRTRGHFKIPDDMKKEIDEYRDDNNNVKLFVNDACILSPDATVSMGRLFEGFMAWCEYNNCQHQKQIRFGKELKRQFKEVSKEIGTNGVHLWRGIDIRSEYQRKNSKKRKSIILTPRRSPY